MLHMHVSIWLTITSRITDDCFYTVPVRVQCSKATTKHRVSVADYTDQAMKISLFHIERSRIFTCLNKIINNNLLFFSLSMFTDIININIVIHIKSSAPCYDAASSGGWYASLLINRRLLISEGCFYTASVQ